MQMAAILVQSKFLPAAIDTAAKAAAIMVAGREIGLSGCKASGSSTASRARSA